MSTKRKRKSLDAFEKDTVNTGVSKPLKNAYCDEIFEDQPRLETHPMKIKTSSCELETS